MRRWSQARHSGTRWDHRDKGNKLNQGRFSLCIRINHSLTRTLSSWHGLPRVIVHSLSVPESKEVPDQPCLTTYFVVILLSVGVWTGDLLGSLPTWINMHKILLSSEIKEDTLNSLKNVIVFYLLFHVPFYSLNWSKFIILTNQWIHLFQRDLILLSALLVMNMPQLDWITLVTLEIRYLRVWKFNRL